MPEDDPQRASSIQDYNDRLRAWVLKDVNTVLKALQRNAAFPILFEEETKPNTPQNNTSNKVTIRSYKLIFPIDWNGLLVRCSVSYSLDFVTFTFVIDIEHGYETWRNGKKEIDAHLQRLRYGFEVATKGFVGEERANAESTQFKLAPERSFADPLQEDEQESGYLFNDCWAEFIDWVKQGTSASAPEQKSAFQFPGLIFADFRGVMARVDANWRDQFPSGSEESRENIERTKSGKLSLDFSANAFRDDEAHWALSAIWPFFKAANPGKNEDQKRRDAVACFMLKNRAIYLSALGAQEEIDFKKIDPAKPVRHSAEEHAPVCFFLLLKGRPNTKQLGRLTERINTCGTLRLAALRDLSAIRTISANARHHGGTLDGITQQLSELAREVQKSPEDKFDRERFAIEAALAELAVEVNKTANLVAGGLHYRTSRTRVFVEQFKNRMKDLRIERIELWQPYDEFMRRNVFEMFDFILAVDERIMALRQRIRGVALGIQTATLVDLTAGIYRVQRSADSIQFLFFVVAMSALFGELFEAAAEAKLYNVLYHAINSSWYVICDIANIFCASDLINKNPVKEIERIRGYICGAALAVPTFALFKLLSDRITGPRRGQLRKQEHTKS
jgi:hypothetical protein